LDFLTNSGLTRAEGTLHGGPAALTRPKGL